MGRRRCSGRLLLIINTSVRKSFKVKMKLIYLKDIDKSILYQGFTIRTALLNQFIDFFGKLAIGETRKISIMWDNQLFTDIDVINQNFNRERYPNHPEMYQVRYSPNHPFAKAMRQKKNLLNKGARHTTFEFQTNYDVLSCSMRLRIKTSGRQSRSPLRK